MIAPSTQRMIMLLAATLAVSGCGSDDVWQSLDDKPNMFSFEAVWAFSPTNVWVGGSPAFGEGESAAIAHFDGESWTSSDVDVGDVAGLWAFGPNDMWAVGGEWVLHYDGDRWEKTSLNAEGARDLHDIWGSSPTDLWAVGERGFFHWDGTAWQRRENNEAVAIWGADPDHIWAIGSFEFMRYEGESWSSFDLDLWGHEGTIWGFGADDVFIAADDEALAHWDGTSWQELRDVEIFGDLQAVWGAASDDVWAAGSFGEIARWNGSKLRSVRRQPMGAPYLMQFTAIHGSSATDVWAVGRVLGAEGHHGVIYHYTGGD